VSQPNANIDANIVDWTFQNYATLASMLSGIAICALIFYIYKRSGSLIFLRDLMWRFFGGSTKFEDEEYELVRKNLREVEYYRFEFNIPAQNLTETKLAEEWIKKHGFCHRDVAKVRNYINWNNFSTLTFKETLFSKLTQNITVGLLIFFFIIISFIVPVTNSPYLMVSLKDAPEAPSFYLSKENAKFYFFKSEPTLSNTECQSAESLEAFSELGFTTDQLDTICSFFLLDNYRTHIADGLKGQRGILLSIVAISIFSVFCMLVMLTRQDVARKLHKKINLPKTTNK